MVVLLHNLILLYLSVERCGQAAGMTEVPYLFTYKLRPETFGYQNLLENDEKKTQNIWLYGEIDVHC